jgi:hypothetical protein
MKTREELLANLGKLNGYYDQLQIFQATDVTYTRQEVRQILSAPTKEQLKCEYCHGKADLNDTANSDFQLNIDTAENEIDVTYDFESGNDYCNFPIHYCPMCGRKLGDE